MALNYRTFITYALVLAPFLQPVRANAQLTANIETIILNKSKLSIFGTSNLNDFECKYDGKFEELALAHQIKFSGNSAAIAGDKLPLDVDYFDCGKRAINRDFKNTLKYREYPFITIELNRVFPVPLLPEYADVTIELAGVKKQYSVKLNEELSDTGQYKIKGEQQLRLSDFKLETPKIMFGLIKVHDELTIHFELYLKPGG